MAKPSTNYERTIRSIESGSPLKRGSKVDRKGESKRSGTLVRATSSSPESSYYKTTRKADEMVNVKRDPGAGFAAMTLSDKVSKRPMSDADKERGLSTKKKKNYFNVLR